MGVDILQYRATIGTFLPRFSGISSIWKSNPTKCLQSDNIYPWFYPFYKMGYIFFVVVLLSFFLHSLCNTDTAQGLLILSSSSKGCCQFLSFFSSFVSSILQIWSFVVQYQTKIGSDIQVTGKIVRNLTKNDRLFFNGDPMLSSAENGSNIRSYNFISVCEEKNSFGASFFNMISNFESRYTNGNRKNKGISIAH